MLRPACRPEVEAAGAGVTINDLAELAAGEACERLTRALAAINAACLEEDCDLTPRQRTLVGTAILKECLGLDVALTRMFGDALVEAWLATQDGRLQ